MRFAKWLPTPLKQSTLDRRIYRQPIAYKPHGLWFDVESDWRRWAEDEHFNLANLAYRHTLRIDTSNVLILKTATELDRFTHMFGTSEMTDDAGNTIDMGGAGLFKVPGHCFIDWPKVAALWKGIIIPEYIWSRRLDLMWYYGWDCASGVVWDTSIVEIVRVRKNKHKYPPQAPPRSIGELEILGEQIRGKSLPGGTWSEEMPF